MYRPPRRIYSFQELFEAQLVGGANVTEAWQKATVLFRMQMKDSGATAPLINPSVEIPEAQRIGHIYPTLPDTVTGIHHTATPPVNAAGINHILSKTKPDDPVAQEMMKRNTALLVESGVVQKLGQGSSSVSEGSDTPMSDGTSSPVEIKEHFKFPEFKHPSTFAKKQPFGQHRGFDTTEQHETPASIIPEDIDDEEYILDYNPGQDAHERYWSAIGGSPDDVRL